MRKPRIERNLAFPTEEFRTRVRSAAKGRGFRTEQAFILAACENALKRDDSTEATTHLEDRMVASLGKVAKEFQSLFTLAHTQFALTNSLLQYVLTCMIEPPDAASARKMKYEDIRRILVDDYLSSEKAVMDGQEILISGRRGLLKPLDDYFGGMNVANITTDVLRDFSSKRMENGVAGPTVNRNLAMLRRMFKLAERESKVSNIPYFPMQKESEPREGFLERPKFEKLRAEMPEPLRPTLTFCYETGCRTGAMAKVVWPWVNLADQEMSSRIASR
jgi:integrase